MSIHVYHVTEIKLGAEALGDAVLVTLHDADSDGAWGALTGHRPAVGTTGDLEFSGTRTERRVRVRIDDIAVKRGAGPGCEFEFDHQDLHVTWLDGQPAEATA